MPAVLHQQASILVAGKSGGSEADGAPPRQARTRFGPGLKVIHPDTLGWPRQFACSAFFRCGRLTRAVFCERQHSFENP